MRITISNNTVLNPLFVTDNSADKHRPPERILGQLSVSSTDSKHGFYFDKVVEYHRPAHEHAMLTSSRWLDFLQFDNADQSHRMAVFGFVFDGETTWYQLWNANKRHVCWVRHCDRLDYQSFAVLAMDALVSLVPNWQGWLFHYPGAKRRDNPFLPVAGDRINEQHVQRMRVSDASTNLVGDLWFLVTIDADAPFSPTARSGWITSVA